MSTRPPAPRAERADAARNRERILQAAERLFAERGVEAVSMDAIAEAAGVGKATLFRRFGDRAGLALALLDARERDLQGLMLRGDPPLGPGAPAEERLVAFIGALVDLLEAHTDLVVASETAPPGARYRSGLYATYHMHVRLLVAEARGPGADADALAELLLAPLAGEHYRHLRRERGMPVERIKAALADLARHALRR
ncbi:MAG TPA: helix-turn-helix domain-containing protein [Miltoncostaeaceae bacterium]|nr:helix-turn-helix domain-containing protein [Miltoncostaeaceae bacterium]